jgi:hypothetical protein
LAALGLVAGAIGLAGLVAMSPALAGAAWGPGPGSGVAASAPGPGGYGMGPGMGGGMGPGMGGTGQGAGVRDGTCLGLAPTAAKGTLTDQQKAALADMAQEEKLAHDLYVAFAARYDATIFDRIARSETQHLTAVRNLLDRYGLPDPTAGKAAGQFSDPAWQADYDRLLAQGSAGEKAALEAAQAVERADIDDLESALDGLSAPDVKQVYTHLLTASRHHLAAFETWASR